jgi:hypothetical protein
MSDAPRKASDVLLELESKIESLISIVRNQDLNIKILSNKLNSVLEASQKAQHQFAQTQPDIPNNIPTVSIFHDDDFTDRKIPVSSESSLPLETAPKGFRRTSRPETYSGDDTYLQKPKEAAPVDHKPAEVIVQQKQVQTYRTPVEEMPEHKQSSSGSIPVQQRTVDKNGKAIFLADIEIVNSETGAPVYKTRTNGAGKWFASLNVGKYKVTLKKKESLSKEKLEATQDIKVDGSNSPLELPMIIVK